MKKIVISVVLCAVVCMANAQITTDERPYGLDAQSGLKVIQQEAVILPVPDKTRIEEEDKINDQQPGPLRYAYPVEVNYTLENSGVWQEMDDGSKIWRLKINLSGALSTNALYNKFWLPDGAKFFVYSDETEQYIGAITSEFIGGSSTEPIAFATGIIYGENVLFEYYQPASVKETAIITISRIDYGYRYVSNPFQDKLKDFGDSGDCQVNINCSEGNNWQAEKHAATRILVVSPGGSGWCSGALINNTNNDYAPYVLTANHCLSGLDAISNNNASQWMFYWEYEHPGCSNSSTSPTLRSTTGATVTANNSTSDFALLRLTQNPGNVIGVFPYYLGWDRSGNAGAGGVGIHHPRGDVKKISTYSITPLSTGYESNSINPNASHWRVVWAQTQTNYGVTEGGSSGSPLLNNINHRIIGQLHGGYASCGALTSPDWYGKFSVSWTSNSATDNRRRLNSWLDPAGTNPTVLIGLAIGIIGPFDVCLPVTYTLPARATSWSVSPASAFSIISQTATSAVVKALNYNGTLGTLTATVNGTAVTKTIATCNISITGPNIVCMEPVAYSLPAGFTATSWTVTPANVATLAGTSTTSATLTANYPTGKNIILAAIVNGNTVTKDLRLCATEIVGPDAIDDTTFVYTLSDPSAFAACTTNRWWFFDPHYLQAGLQPDTATTVFTPATLTLNSAAGTYTAIRFLLYFGCDTIPTSNAIFTPVIIPPAASGRPAEMDTLQILRKDDDENLPE